MDQTDVDIKEMPKRDMAMDWLKGIAIVLVVVGHNLYGIKSMTGFYNIIYSFHMPLFFFVSGYLEEKGKGKRNSKKLIARRAVNLLLPYFTWTIVYNYNMIVSGKTDWIEILKQLLGFSQSGLWFLAVLFGLKCVHILLWFLKDSFKTNSFLGSIGILAVLEGLILLIAVMTRHPYLINMLSYAIIYFIGIEIVSYKSMKNLVLHPITITACMLCYLIGIQYFSFYNTTWITQVIRIFLSFCVISVLFKFTSVYELKGKLMEGICMIGKNSLGIYLIHVFFSDYGFLMTYFNNTILNIFIVIAMSLMVCIVCIVIIYIFKLSPFISKLTFGN